MSEALPPSSQVAHYRIISKLGAGGMGEVYLAQDTKLDRKVALTILAPGCQCRTQNRSIVAGNYERRLQFCYGVDDPIARTKVSTNLGN